MNYNHFELLELSVNGHETYGRPVEFDQESVGQTSKGADGKWVKPVKASSTCPDCGQGFIVAIFLSDPPFERVDLNCPICRPAPLPMQDPFSNPFKTGRITAASLEPMVRDADKPIDKAKTTVAERLQTAKKAKKKPAVVPPTPEPVSPAPPLSEPAPVKETPTGPVLESAVDGGEPEDDELLKFLTPELE